MKLKYLLLAPILLLLAGCDQPSGPKEVGLGEIFELKVGQMASVRGESLSVVLEAVPEDSRCPQGVDCVWAGNGRVVLRLEKGSDAGKLELNTTLEPRKGDFLDYSVSLVDLKPQPIADKPTPPDQYVAVLTVSKR